MCRMDETFQCHACGEGVNIPDRSRFTLSTGKPAVCPGCGAPHVYEAGIQMDQDWVRKQLQELAELRRQRSQVGQNEPA
jgi:hypothetical protein